MIGKFSNKYAFFVFWSIFITNVPFDVILSWLVFEFLSNFLADTYHIGNIFLRINLDLFHWQVIRKWHSTFMCRFSFSAFKGKCFFKLLFFFLHLLWVCFIGKTHLIFVAFNTLSFLTVSNTFVLS